MRACSMAFRNRAMKQDNLTAVLFCQARIVLRNTLIVLVDGGIKPFQLVLTIKVLLSPRQHRVQPVSTFGGGIEIGPSFPLSQGSVSTNTKTTLRRRRTVLSRRGMIYQPTKARAAAWRWVMAGEALFRGLQNLGQRGFQLRFLPFEDRESFRELVPYSADPPIAR